MPQGELLTIMMAGLAVAALHAALPTHWLPFVLAARAQGWSAARLLAVNLTAGAGHVAFTALLGGLVVWAGMAVPEEWADLVPRLAAALLIAIGAFALWRDWKGRDPHMLGHHHAASCHHQLPAGMIEAGGSHQGHDHGHGHGHGHGHDNDHGHGHGHHHGAAAVMQPARSEWATIGALFGLLTLSPCESFLPLYLAGAPAGWTGFAVLTGTLAAGTVIGMSALTMLAHFSLARLRLAALEKHEGRIVGALLIGLGFWMLAAGH